MDGKTLSTARLKEYYGRRALEYERIYEKPERQGELARLKRRLRALSAGAEVLEVACGTGYWTRVLAAAAGSILAADVSPEVLEVARGKPYPPGKVRFAEADAYRIDGVPGRFDAIFAGFFLSHVPRPRLLEFRAAIHRCLPAGGRVVLVDNLYVEGSSTPIAGRDEHGNTYQDRRLDSGEHFSVLKNFPTGRELKDFAGADAAGVELDDFKYYWCLTYRTAGPEPKAAGGRHGESR